jgi:hypothetical protein
MSGNLNPNALSFVPGVGFTNLNPASQPFMPGAAAGAGGGAAAGAGGGVNAGSSVVLPGRNAFSGRLNTTGAAQPFVPARMRQGAAAGAGGGAAAGSQAALPNMPELSNPSVPSYGLGPMLRQNYVNRLALPDMPELSRMPESMGKIGGRRRRRKATRRSRKATRRSRSRK